MIDDHPVLASYIEGDSEYIPERKSPLWMADHVRESQYMVQVIKCKNRECCSEPRSSYFSIIADRFIPGPLSIKNTPDDGLKVCIGRG